MTVTARSGPAQSGAGMRVFPVALLGLTAIGASAVLWQELSGAPSALEASTVVVVGAVAFRWTSVASPPKFKMLIQPGIRARS